MQRTLGFVANPRRFNGTSYRALPCAHAHNTISLVAVTRAQALLIVIGNPQTLSLDPMWRGWLNYVYQRGGWRGKEISWDPEEALEDGGYDEKTRTRAEAEAEEMIQRIRSQIMSNDAWALWQASSGDDEDEDDNAAAVEYAGREAD